VTTATKTKPTKKKPAAKRATVKALPEWEFEASQLWWAWAVCGKLRSKNEGRPILCGIHAEEFPGGVLFVATDAYRLGRVWVPFRGSETEAPPLTAEPIRSVLISDWHQRVEPFLNHQRRMGAIVTVTPQERVVAFAGDGESITPQVVPSADNGVAFPAWRGLVDNPREASASLAFNPTYLADICSLAKKAKKGAPLVIEPAGPLGPAHMTIKGDGVPDAHLLLMPVRVV
jgi:hypothetical protein